MATLDFFFSPGSRPVIPRGFVFRRFIITLTSWTTACSSSHTPFGEKCTASISIWDQFSYVSKYVAWNDISGPRKPLVPPAYRPRLDLAVVLPKWFQLLGHEVPPATIVLDQFPPTFVLILLFLQAIYQPNPPSRDHVHRVYFPTLSLGTTSCSPISHSNCIGDIMMSLLLVDSRTLNPPERVSRQQPTHMYVCPAWQNSY